MPSGLPRDTRGVRIDVEGSRDLSFNNWHRTLNKNCFVTDVDFLEYRFENNNLVLKAILEVKKGYVDKSTYIEESANFKAIKLLSERAEVPFYHVWYYKNNYNDSTEQINKFLVWDTRQSKNSIVQKTPEEMKIFLESL